MTQTTFEQFVELATRGTFVPVCREIMADLLTPVSAFLKIAEHSDYAFLLESVEGGEHVGRYSFLGKDPFLILRGRSGETLIERAGVTTTAEKPFIEAIKAGKTDAESINEYFKTIDVPGVTKQIKFAENGEPAASDVYVYLFKGGKYSLLGNAKEATKPA